MGERGRLTVRSRKRWKYQIASVARAQHAAIESKRRTPYIFGILFLGSGCDSQTSNRLHPYDKDVICCTW